MSVSLKTRLVVLSALAITMFVPLVGTQSQSVSAAVPCGVTPSSKKFVVNADNTITGTIKIEGDASCKSGASVMVWNADPSLHPKPAFWTTQTVHDIKSGTFAPGEYSFTVKLPVCSTDPKIVSGYQADIVADANPPRDLTPPGAGGYWDKRQEGNGGYMVTEYKIGGNKCPAPVTPVTPVVTPPVVTPPVTETPVQPVTPVAAATPETLPETGAGSVLTIAGLVGSVSAFGHHLVMRRRKLAA